LHEQKIIGFAPIYDCHAQTVAADGDRTFDLSLDAHEGALVEQAVSWIEHNPLDRRS
jgi:hypothetical protein